MRRGLSIIAMLCLWSAFVYGQNPSGDLRIELIAGHNFTVRNNIESQPGTSPYAAVLGAKIFNDGTTVMTNVYAYIGNYDGGGSPTPGIYPSRTHPGLTGTLSLQHVGGSVGLADASRYIGRLEPGESITMYWLVEYPLMDETGQNVTLGSKPDDDLFLYFDIWARADQGASTYTADVRRRVYMRRMLQAMANKISPNTANKVPEKYKQLLDEFEPEWRNPSISGAPGARLVTEGIWFDLGNINQGFDNDGDLMPDYNAWMQPIGNPALFDPGSFRLVRTYVLLVVKRSGGKPDLVIVEEDKLYHTKLPPDNTGAVGYIAYEFVALQGGQSSTLSPYHPIASGRDQEKFNGDYGAGGGTITSKETDLVMEKTVNLASAEPGDTLHYTVSYTNAGDIAIGLPEFGLPLSVQDTIPEGTVYIGGSAAVSNTLPVGVTSYTIFYSTDNGQSWSDTEPATAADVTDIQWWLSDALEPDASGVVTFSVEIETAPPPPPLIYNVAGIGLGDLPPFLTDDAITRLIGDWSISGTVFEDTGDGDGTSGNGVQDGAEPGISNVVVRLYYDANGSGTFDEGDVLFASTVTDANGDYVFEDLPDGEFVIVVDDKDEDIPTGYTPTNPTQIAVVIDGASSSGHDFGFAPGLVMTKTGPSFAEKGDQISYTISVSNSLAAASGQSVQFTSWATNNVAGLIPAGDTAFTNPQNATGAPNGTSATANLATNTDYALGLGGYTISGQSGSIDNVLVLLHFDNTNYTRNRTDTLTLNVRTNASLSIAPVFSVTYSIPNDLGIGTTGVLTNDVTGALDWDFSYFDPSNNKLYIQLTTTRQGGGQANTMGIDAVGFTVTTDDEFGVMDPVPLFDHYDTNVLEFVSATPSVTTNDFGGPAPNTGRLYWENLGPLSPGDSASVTVNFNVIGPAGNAGTITTNSAVITNAFFTTGTPTNDAFDEAPTEIPATGSIGDTIFWDANVNGTQDDGEAGIPGVTVQLYDTNSVLLAEQVTDSNGNYLFDNLAAGTYVVLVVTNGASGYPLNDAALSAHPDNDGLPIGHPDLIDPVTSNVTTVQLSAGQTYLGADFGYVPPGGTIGGVLWVDTNDNGVPDFGEDVIPFIQVSLFDGAGNLVDSMETDADGNYLFYGLADGSYSVVVDTDDEDFPSRLEQSFDPDGVLDSVATNIVISGGTIVTIDGDPWTAGDLEVNFGYRYVGNNVLSGTVGLDDPDNPDGLLNGLNPSGVGSNESALVDVPVYIYLWNDDDENGVVDPGETFLLGVTTTDENGDYSFSGLPDGGPNSYYIVSVAAPFDKLELTTDMSSGTPAILIVETQNNVGDTLAAYQAVPIIAVTENVDFAFISTEDYDFGDLPDSYRTLLGSDGPRHVVNTNNPTLFLGAGVTVEPDGQPSVDADADDLDDGVFVDGVWQNAGQGGVRVHVGAGTGWLVGFIDFANSGEFDNANELVVSQAVSFDGGAESNGWYDITFDVPEGSLSTTNSTYFYSRWRLLPNEPFFPSFSFQGEASDGEVEDYRWAFHLIAGSVFEDTDDDGDFSGGDTPQAGVIVNLFNTNNVLLATTVTDFDGSYSFYGVPDGDYHVTIIEPSGSTAILARDSMIPTNIAVAVAGDSVFDRDFLLDTNGVRYAISGTVFDDDGYGVTGDGVFNVPPDEPVPNVTVTLYRDLDGDGVPHPNELVGTTQTDANGLYQFPDLPEGDYIVVMTVPDGAVAVTDADGNDNGPTLIEVELSGGDQEDQDFLIDGLVTTVTLSGLVWFDEDRDGIRDSSETNRFAGIPVALLDASSNVVAVVTTSALGTYQFNNVTTATYTVRFDLSSLDPMDYEISPAFQGSDPSVDSNVTGGEVGDFAFTDAFAVSGQSVAQNIDLGLMPPIPLDLGVGKIATPSLVLETETIVFSLSVTNFSDEVTATGVTVQDFLPAPLVFTTNDAPSHGTFDTNTLIWTIGTLETNAVATMAFTVTAPPGSGGLILTNTLMLTGVDQTDTNPTNNIAQAVVEILGTDLALTKTVDNPYPSAESEVTYTIEVTNLGPSDTTGVTVLEPLTNGISYVSHVVSTGSYNDVTGVWTIGDLNVNDTVTMEITVLVSGDTLGSAITNLSIITNSDIPDPNPDNDWDTAVISVTDPDIMKYSDVDGYLQPGDIITYTVVVTNRGASVLTGVTVVDEVPAGTTYVADSIQGVLSPLNPVIPTSTVYNTSGTHSFVVPAGVSNLTVEVWGAGGGGGTDRGAGGGGGGYARSVLTVTPGATNTLVVGSGGGISTAGGASWFGSSSTVFAGGGGGGGSNTSTAGGAGGSGNIGDVTFNGGAGGPRSGQTGGGGGGSAFTNAVGQAGGTPAGGDGTGPGGDGGTTGISGSPGTAPGGGGGAGGNGAPGAFGAPGRVIVNYDLPGPVGTIGAPPNIATGWTLQGNASLVLTYQVQVNDPLSVTQVCNTAVVTADQSPIELFSTVCDPVDPSLLAAVGDRVWLDENADGIQDAGEAGIPNVTIEILDADSVVVATTITDMEGNYLVTGLAPGTYTVRVATNSLPAGLRPNQTYDPDATMDHQTTVTLSMGEVFRDADFGYNWTSATAVFDDTGNGAIGDRVWIDANGDGVQDPGEAGLAGVTVRLMVDLNSNGVYSAVFATTTTDAAGNYIFRNLPPGAYVVEVSSSSLPAGYTQTGDPDDFGAVAQNPDHKTTMPIILAPGDTFVNADFGYQRATSSDISGKVYFDANADEDFDAGDGDFGIQGVSVVLMNASGKVMATTRTDAEGNYTFSGLPAGTYTVWVNDTGNLLGGLEQTEDPDATKDSRHTITVNGSTDVENLDFGYTPDGHGSDAGLIGSRIWLDLDGDGNQDAGEPGLQGVTVELYESDGTTLLATTVTDANGNYWFGGLDTDDTTYIVRVDTSSLPNGGVGLVNTYDPDDGEAPPHDGDSEAEVTLTAGNPIRLDQDFGYHVAEDANTISGKIWEDRNADGEMNEAVTNGLAGITVMLTDTNGNVIATAVTDAEGDYMFSGLPDGTYSVKVTDEANLLNGWWHSKGEEGDGTVAGTDAGQSQPDPYTITVSGGADAVIDFGYYYEGATLGNRVWVDENANGIQDEDEEGLPGVTLRLTIVYSNGVTNVVTTVSDTDGFYSFGNLLLDENHNGTNEATPTYIISAINPGGGFNHTIFNKSGVLAPDNSENPNGIAASVVQGVTNVSLNEDDPYDPGEEPQQAWYDFGFTVQATLAVISGVRSRVEDGVAVISWDVSLEIGTIGYYLERQVDDDWLRINSDLVASDPFADAPFTYEQVDADAPLGTTQTYRIVELDDRGELLYYGPYTLELDGGEVSYWTWAAGIDWGDADSSPDADPDGDGLTNWQEYLAGTDPLNANSVLRVSSFKTTAEGIVLRWPGVEGRYYAIEVTTSLLEPFQAIATDIPGEEPETFYVVPVSQESGARAFYRVILQ